MPLSEQRRKQLDSIVSQMSSNKESDKNIQTVVNDFKSKYENENQPKQEGFLKSLAKNVASPFLKFGTSVYNVGSSIGKVAKGDANGALTALDKSRNIPFFGQTEPLLASSDVNQQGARGYLPPVKKPVGTALQMFSTIAPVGKIGSGLKAIAGSATKFGTASALGDIGNQLESNKEFNPAQTVASFGLGALVPTTIGGGKSLLSGVKNRLIGKTAGRVLDRELQVATPELTASIEKGVKSFGDKAAEIVDKKGKPLYVGNYNTLLNKAKTDLIESGTQLNKTLQKLDQEAPIKITRDQVASDIINKLQDTQGVLTPTKIKQIKFEVSRMPKVMNRQELLKTKRLYDSLIPDNFWTNNNEQAGFVTQVKYVLRDNARKVLNDVTPDANLQKLNNRLSVAMDMRKLSAQQIALRDKQKNPLSLANAISRIIDDTILNPAITTRIGQAGAYTKNIVPKSVKDLTSKLPLKNTLTIPNLIRQSLNQ